MNEKRKAPGSVGALSGAAEGETADAMFPCMESITNGWKRQGQITNYLPVGANHPLTAKELSTLCGHTDQRRITREIEALRRSGFPVCASTNAERPGYFRAENPAELAVYLHSLRGRMKEITHTYNALERVLCEWEGQETMWGDDANG